MLVLPHPQVCSNVAALKRIGGVAELRSVLGVLFAFSRCVLFCHMEQTRAFAPSRCYTCGYSSPLCVRYVACLPVALHGIDTIHMVECGQLSAGVQEVW